MLNNNMPLNIPQNSYDPVADDIFNQAMAESKARTADIDAQMQEILNSRQTVNTAPAAPAQDNIAAQIQEISKYADAPRSKMQDRTGGFINNYIQNIREVGTGLNALWTNKGDYLKQAPEWIKDYISSGNITHATRDAINLALEPYNIKVEELSNRDIKDILGGVVQGIYQNPFDATLDFISLGGAGLIRNSLKKLPIAGKFIKGGEVEKALKVEGVEQARNIEPIRNKLDDVKKLAKENNVNLDDVVRAAETGADLPKGGLPVYKALKSAMTDYDEIIKKVSPETYMGMRDTAITQKIVRDRELTGHTNFSDVEREIRPMLDLISEGKIADVENLAKTNSATAKLANDVLEANKLYEKGRIFPVTHVNAMELGTQRVADIASAADRTLNRGRFSERVLGTQTYQDIANQLVKPDLFLEQLGRRFLDRNLSNAILAGEFGGLSIAPSAAKNTVFLDRKLLENGNVSEALKRMEKTAQRADDISMDKWTAQSLKEQLESGAALQGFLGNAYRIGKSNLLAQGTYLGANAITGASNLLMNSGAYAISDLIDAVKSQGKLAKEMGLYRRDIERLSKEPLVNFIERFNRYTGGAVTRFLDRKIQNTLAEAGAHAELRKLGYGYNQRLNAIANMEKKKLGDTIMDVARVANLNSTRTLLPQGVANSAFLAINPFWRWQDTATQGTIRMLEKNPIAANVVLGDVLTQLAFNDEMQNRMNLHADIDKPYVTFKVDPNTGNFKTISAEFVPMTTTLKLIDFTGTDYARNPNLPIIGDLYMAAQGKGTNGKPLRRGETSNTITQIINNTRYEFSKDNPYGELKPIGGKGDEILNTALRTVFGLPNLANKTIFPLLAPLFNEEGEYYQPYAGSLVGSFGTSGTQNIIMGGDPRRSRSAQDVINALSGTYEQDVYNMRPQANLQNRFFRQYNREQARYGGQ